MPEPPDERRLQVALRLKAARYLAGRASADGRAIPLPVGELAARPDLTQNRISANRLEEIEQRRVTARPMELERIAAGLGLPHDWFAADGTAERLGALSQSREAELLEASERDLEELVQQERRDDETGEPGQADTGPGGAPR